MKDLGTLPTMPVALPGGQTVNMAKTPGLLQSLKDVVSLRPGDLRAPSGGVYQPPVPLGLPAAAGAASGSIAPDVQVAPEQLATAPAPTPAPAEGAVSVPDAPAGPMGSALPSTRTGPVRVIKGGLTEVGRTIEQGDQISGERQDQIETAAQGRVDSAQKARDDLAEAQANARIDEQLYLQNQEDQIEKRRGERIAVDDRIRAADAERDAANKRAEAAAVDPTRYYASKPTWAKALAGIGMAIQAALQRYGEGLSGQSAQPLRGVEVIRQAWRDDIEQQKIKFEQARDQADLANNRYAEMIKLHGTPEAAELALQEQQAKLAAQWLENKKQAVTDQQQIAALDAVIGEVRQQGALLGAELDARTGDRITREVRLMPDRIVGGGGARKPTEEAGRRVRLPDGSYGWAASEGVAKGINERVGGRINMLADIAEIERLKAKGDRAGAENVARGLSPKINVLRGQGAMSEDEAANMQTYLGNAGDLVNPRGKARLDAAKRQLQGELDSTLSQDVYRDPNLTAPLPR